MEIIYKQVVSDEELYQILELQHKNIPASISETEKQKEGFVTVHHDFQTLIIKNGFYYLDLGVSNLKIHKRKNVF